MPYKLKDPVRHKFAKKKYKIQNWKSYEKGLHDRVNRPLLSRPLCS